MENLFFWAGCLHHNCYVCFVSSLFHLLIHISILTFILLVTGLEKKKGREWGGGERDKEERKKEERKKERRKKEGGKKEI